MFLGGTLKKLGGVPPIIGQWDREDHSGAPFVVMFEWLLLRSHGDAISLRPMRSRDLEGHGGSRRTLFGEECRGKIACLAKKKNRRECENARTDRHRAEKEPSAFGREENLCCVCMFVCVIRE